MPWWGWAIIVFVVLGIIGSANQPTKKRKRGQQPKRQPAPTESAEDIAAKVLTWKDFKALQRRLERAKQSLDSSDSEAKYDRAGARYELLDEAVDLAATKVYRWQFIPDLSLETSLKVAEAAYSVVGVEDLEAKKRELGADDWYPLDGYSDPEPNPPGLSDIRRFRAIVESDLPRDEAIKKINALCSRSKPFREEEFFSDEKLKPGDEWFASRLSADGLPDAYTLYSEGYTTPERCLELDPDEYGKRKGVGPKRVAALRAYQAKMKGQAIDT